MSPTVNLKLLVGLLMAIVLAVGCASVSGTGEYNRSYDFAGIERTAVVSVDGIGGQANRDQVAAMFNQALLGLGYSPVERSRINTVIEEQDFSRSQITTAEGAARAGRILNVDTVVLVNVPEFGDNMSMTAQMIDVEDGKYRLQRLSDLTGQFCCRNGSLPIHPWAPKSILRPHGS